MGIHHDSHLLRQQPSTATAWQWQASGFHKLKNWSDALLRKASDSYCLEV